MTGWIAYDLDGTLAHWHESHFPGIGAPIPTMIAHLKKNLERGMPVRIFTARVAVTGEYGGERAFADYQRRLIQDWCMEHIGVALPVTATLGAVYVRSRSDRRRATGVAREGARSVS